MLCWFVVHCVGFVVNNKLRGDIISYHINMLVCIRDGETFKLLRQLHYERALILTGVRVVVLFFSCDFADLLIIL